MAGSEALDFEMVVTHLSLVPDLGYEIKKMGIWRLCQDQSQVLTPQRLHLNSIFFYFKFLISTVYVMTYYLPHRWLSWHRIFSKSLKEGHSTLRITDAQMYLYSLQCLQYVLYRAFYNLSKYFTGLTNIQYRRQSCIFLLFIMQRLLFPHSNFSRLGSF